MGRIKPGKPRRSPMVMFPEKKMNAKDKMTWFLGFLNEDIDSLRSGDFLKLLYDFGEFIYGYPTLKMLGMWDKPGDRALVKLSQEFFKIALESIPKGKGPKKYSVPYELVVREDRVFKVRNFAPWFEPAVRVAIDEAFRGQLFDALIELLSQFPLSRIKTCQKPDCGKWLFRYREGTKGDYCSERCRSWARYMRHKEKRNKRRKEKRAKSEVVVECPGNFEQVTLTPTECINGNEINIRNKFDDCRKCPHFTKEG